VQPLLRYELSQVRDDSETTAACIDKEVQRLLAEALLSRNPSARQDLSNFRGRTRSELVNRLLSHDCFFQWWVLWMD